MFDAGHFLSALGAILGSLSVLYAPTENIKKVLLKQIKEQEDLKLEQAAKPNEESNPS